MSLLFALTGLCVILENDLLFAAAIANESSLNRRREDRRANLYITADGAQQRLKRYRVALRNECLNFQLLSRGNLILLAASFDNCEICHGFN